MCRGGGRFCSDRIGKRSVYREVASRTIVIYVFNETNVHNTCNALHQYNIFNVFNII